MRMTTTLGRLWGARGLAAAALLVCSAGLASAQAIRFDGNILFNNGSGGTTNYSGTATGVGVGLCTPGTNNSTLNIATVQYKRNDVADPLFSLGSTDSPNFRPNALSPAFCGNNLHRVLNLSSLGSFFVNSPWAGALGPSEPDWTAGWTYYSLDGAGRTDLNDGAPVVILDNQNLYSDRTLSADSVYLVRGQLRVKNQATLNIPAGTVIFQESATVGTMIIERGGRINAVGTPTDPIIITSDQEPGQQAPGSTGGLFIHGRARVNNSNSCAGDSSASEGGLVGYYGGNDDADDSGVLQYVRVEFGGNLISEGNEANSFTFNGVGTGTTIDHLQAHRGKDDLFEFFGGTAQCKYLLGTYGGDDGFDWQMGYRGKAQYVAIRQLAVDAGAEKGIEADNNEFDNDATLCAGRSNPTLSHFTLVGDRGTTLSGQGVQFRRGTAGTLVNSIIYNFRGAGFAVDSATFANHCRNRASVVRPGIACQGGSVDAPLASGRVFVASGFPNPFRNEMSVRFALPKSGDVTVDVYSASGRHVAQLANGAYGAGEHTVKWTVGKSVPAGVYFYKVRTAVGESSGKLVRMP